MNTKSKVFFKLGAALSLTLLLGIESAHATKYYYTVESSSPFFYALYPNDKPYGGDGRGRFQLDFTAVNITVEADDKANTVKMTGTMRGAVNPNHEPIGSLEQLAPGLYSLNVLAQGVTVRDPRTSDTPFALVGATTPGHGLDGKFTNLDNEPKWLYGTGVQDFWGMPFNGTPPAGDAQIANLMFGAQHLSGPSNLFVLSGWVFSGMKAGFEPFMRGDFHAKLRFTGANGNNSEIPEPATLGLLGSALALAPLSRRRRRSA